MDASSPCRPSPNYAELANFLTTALAETKGDLPQALRLLDLHRAYTDLHQTPPSAPQLLAATAQLLHVEPAALRNVHNSTPEIARARRILLRALHDAGLPTTHTRLLALTRDTLRHHLTRALQDPVAASLAREVTALAATLPNQDVA